MVNKFPGVKENEERCRPSAASSRSVADQVEHGGPSRPSLVCLKALQLEVLLAILVEERPSDPPDVGMIPATRRRRAATSPTANESMQAYGPRPEDVQLVRQRGSGCGIASVADFRTACDG
jgi:hypothetical protein